MFEAIASLLRWIEAAWKWGTENFNALAGWASILGLVISAIVMFRVRSLRAALLEHALGRAQRTLFDQVRTSLIGKPELTVSHRRDLRSLLDQVEEKHTSCLPFLTKRVKHKIAEIRGDVPNMTSPDLIVTKLDQLRILICNDSRDY